MILFLGVILFAVLLGYATGGRLRNFERLRLRWWGLAPLGFALQAVPLPNARQGEDLLVRVLVLGTSYALILVVAALNFRVSGVPILFIGLALNALAVVPNGGMPVSRDAVIHSDQKDVLALLEKDEGAKHHLMTPADHLTPIADVIPLGPPVRQVVSLGDIFVYTGLTWLIVSVMRGRTRGLVLPSESGHYRGKHRSGPSPESDAIPRPPVPPAAATTTSGT
jgi:hypothetical protein